MKCIQPYLLILFGLLLIVSCETSTELSDPLEEPPSKTLRLNFHENLLELNPLKAKSRSEEFVKELVFDKFMEKDFNSLIFESYEFDSLQFTYTFQLNSDQQFHDGSPLNSKSIQNFFKYLIHYQFEIEPVHLLFSSMDGFGLVNWYRENRNILDSIPRGFQILDETRFSIKLRNNEEKLLQWFQHPIFTLFKESNGQYVGSGDFELKELNEDISARLVRRNSGSSNIQTILLSFIKNRDLEYAEFFRGELDLVLYQPAKSNTSPQTQRLDKLLKSQYPEYKVAQNKRSIIKYLVFKEFNDSGMLQNVLASLNIKSNKIIYENEENIQLTFDSDSLSKVSIGDSTIRQVQWYTEGLDDSVIYFTNTSTIDFVKTNSEKLNQTEPHIVIKEMEVDFWGEIGEKALIMELTKQYEFKENSIIMVLEVFPEYVIYNNKLKVVQSKTKISELAKTAYFQKIKTY